jgi:cytochrome c5
MSDEHKFNLIPLLVGTAVVVAIIITFAVVIGNKSKKLDEEEVNVRIQPVAKVEIAAIDAVAGARTGEQVVQAACAACHDTGAIGAPKTGDKAAWAPRLALGLDGLLKSAIAGKNAMPPRGGADATDDELERAIAFMANQSGANFKAPQ